jgi:hypothetical protein
LRPGIAGVADLDGDHIPDVASGTNLGRTEQGYNYRVDLDLTDNSQAKPFSVISNEPNGLDIETIDVDGDQDLDLVITSRLLQLPIGIWINDGQGNFTQDDSTPITSLLCAQRSSLTQTLPIAGCAICSIPRHVPLPLDRYRIAAPKRTRSSEGRIDSIDFHDFICAESARFRAPPIVPKHLANSR